jgi:hypothetical protein
MSVPAPGVCRENIDSGCPKFPYKRRFGSIKSVAVVLKRCGITQEKQVGMANCRVGVGVAVHEGDAFVDTAQPGGTHGCHQVGRKCDCSVTGCYLYSRYAVAAE